MAQQAQQNPQQANAFARAIIQANGVEMTQQIYNNAITPTVSNVINIQPRNVGLIKGFWIELTAAVSCSSGTLTPTDFGPSNLLSQIVFTDLNNNTRIQTTGWHLAMVNTAKARRVYGSAAPFGTGHDSPMNFGSNWNVISQTASIAAAATGVVVMRYFVPLAYSDTDYRGAVYANVVNATMNLQLTVNANPVSVAGADSTASVYKGGVGSITSIQVSVYQLFMDQIPFSNGFPILPAIDLSTIYELKNTVFPPTILANTEFAMQYSNFRDYLSTFVVYYNGAARAAGTDISYLSLQAANFSNIWKKTPALIAMQTRNILGVDMPPGTYYFSSRAKPISSQQYGNIELIINPSTAGATAYLGVGYEDFAMVNNMQVAGSLPT